MRRMVEIDGKIYTMMEDGSPQRQAEDDRSKEEKMSEFARTRDRDRHGRFVGKQDDVNAYYDTPYKVVWRPNPKRKWVLERREELHWYQKTYYWGVMGLGGFGICSIVVMAWEGIKAMFR